jgi:hypothetical protein
MAAFITFTINLSIFVVLFFIGSSPKSDH